MFYTHTRSKPFLEKSLAAFTIAVFTLSYVAFVPVSALAFSYVISVTNADFTGSTLTLTGLATADYVGQVDHQWVSFNWGDGPPIEVVHAEDLPGYSVSGGVITLTNWTRSHPYTTTGSFSVTVKIYHGNAQGHEGSQTESNTVIIQTENTAVLCSDGIDNDHDGLIDLNDPDCAAFLPGTLHVVKVVDNTDGGTLLADDFSFSINGGSSVAFEPDGQNDVTLGAGTYTVTETSVSGYAVSYNTCAGISLVAGGEATCTITNDDIAPTLTLEKTVVNFDGGTATEADFQGKIDGSDVDWDVVNVLPVGNHTASEFADVTGYVASSWGGDCNADGTITLSLGEDAICTITNDDIAPTIKVVKTVVNNNGGGAVANDFSFSLDSIVALFHNIAAVTTAGLHTVSEASFFGYTQSVWGGDCGSSGSITLALDQDATCTIANDDIAPKLTVTKIVTNNDGGTLSVLDFPLFVDSNAVTSGAQVTYNAGIHTVSETNQFGYVGTIGGDCAADGSITLNPGDVKACTVTNDDVAPGLTVIKSVTNDNGGTFEVGDFILRVDGDPVTSGQTNYGLSAGDYVVSEDGVFGYAGTIGGDCNANGDVTLGVGETKVCTIANDDIAPILKLVKDVINDNGGTAVSGAWTLTADGDDGFSDAGDSTAFHTVRANENYDLSESDVSGYSSEGWSCDGGFLEGDALTLALDEDVTCTISNNDVQPMLTVYKNVLDPKEQYESSFFDIFVDLTLVDVGVMNGFDAGTYAVTEDVSGDLPEGVSYEPSFAGDCDGNGSVTLDVGDEATCTITNTIVYSQCSDGIDNDLDGTTDFGSEGGDVSCSGPGDNNESDDKTPPVSEFDDEDKLPHEIIETELVSLTLTGVSTDDLSGVASAKMTIYRLADAETMDGEGFFVSQREEQSPFRQLSCDPLSQGAIQTELVTLSLTGADPLNQSWSKDWTPARGVYCAIVHATDVAGNIESTGVAGPFAYTFMSPIYPQCNDSIDNDGDGEIDHMTDPGCTDANDNDEINQSGGGGGGGNGPVENIYPATSGGGNGPVGQVLGASIELPASCTEYLHEYIKLGKDNNPDEVKKLQAFLNSLGEKLPVTGFYGPLSFAAVKRFQVKESVQILTPWQVQTGGIDSSGTGYVYKTTKRWINLLNCPVLNLPMPQLP